MLWYMVLMCVCVCVAASVSGSAGVVRRRLGGALRVVVEESSPASAPEAAANTNAAANSNRPGRMGANISQYVHQPLLSLSHIT